MARLVQRDRLFIVRDRARVVVQRFQCEAEGVQRLDVRGVDPERRLECLPRRLPVVLNREQLAEVVVDLSGVRLVAEALLELDLCRVESADDHQVAAEGLMGLGVSDIELERLRQRVDGCADFLLSEQAVAERVPAPRRLRALRRRMPTRQRLDFLETCPVECNPRTPLRASESSPSGGGAPFTLLLQHDIEVALRLRRLGLQLERVTELGRRILQFAFLQRGAAVGDVQRRILVAIVSRNELATLPELGCRFFRASGARQREAELIVSLPARRAPVARPPASSVTASATFPSWRSALPRARWARANVGDERRRPCAAARSLSPTRARGWRHKPSRD